MGRSDSSGNRATLLDVSATDRPRSSEVEASASPHDPVLVRTSPAKGLPPLTTRRWVVRRKAAVIAAVCSGEITLEEACRWYQLSEEEFLSWKRAFESHGLRGLRIARTQQYRVLRPARSRSCRLNSRFSRASLAGLTIRLANVTLRWEPLVTERDIGDSLPVNESRGRCLPIDGWHYREMTHGLRKLARQCSFAGARSELLQLAASYERRADHLDGRPR